MYKVKKNRKGMNTAVVGVDVGEEKSEACYLSPVGYTLDQFNFRMTDAGWSEFASKIPREIRIAFEASGLAYNVTKKLAELGYSDVTVAHPKELVWITKSKRKNDRVDSGPQYVARQFRKKFLNDQSFREGYIKRMEVKLNV